MRSQHLKPQVIDHVLSSRRQSTNRLYDIRWRVWYDHCLSLSIDPLHPTVAEFAAFLTNLHESKRLSAGTIAGYKSAIVSTISLARGVRSPNFSTSVVISHLLDGFRRATYSRTNLCPRWDITVVLSFLRDHCEPLASVHMRLLTFKTVFLVAMATARRISGIHAISGLPRDISFNKDLSSVTLNFLPEFRAKNQANSELSQSFSIPGLQALLCPDDTDKFLCPVRALSIYLHRTKGIRHNKRRLFISLNPNYDRDVQKGTIVRWIRTLIQLLFAQCASSLSPSSFRAHETRAIAASLAVDVGASLDSVMKMAFWKSETTFLNFYVRDVSQQCLDNSFSLGPAVFAGHSSS